MKSEWKTYRTRFLVQAKQLTSTLSFTDHLGRQHCGRRGDYLVESFDGVLSIAPRHIFEDIYVPMSSGETPSPDGNLDHDGKNNQPCLTDLRIERLKIERIRDVRNNAPLRAPRLVAHELLPRVRRKSPLAVRDTGSRLGLM